jgi:hypothetical protein
MRRPNNLAVSRNRAKAKIFAGKVKYYSEYMIFRWLIVEQAEEKLIGIVQRRDPNKLSVDYLTLM